MANLGSINVDFTATTSGFDAAMRRMRRQIQELSRETIKSNSKLANAGKQTEKSLISPFVKFALNLRTAEYLVTELVGGVKNLIEPAVQMESAVARVGMSLDKNADQFKTWVSENARAMNMGQKDAMEMAATYSNLFKTFTKGEDTMKMTQLFMQQTAVIASAQGRSIADVADRIRSGILGETESIENLGINTFVSLLKTSEAFKRFANGRGWDQLDFQTKQAVTSFAILQQSMEKFGVNVVPSSGAAIQYLASIFQDIWLEISKGFLPLVNALLPTLNILGEIALAVAMKFRMLMESIFGVRQVTAAVSSVSSNFAGSLDEETEAAKKLKKAMDDNLQSFDQIHKIQPDKSSKANAPGAAPDISGALQDIGIPILDMKIKFNPDEVLLPFTTMLNTIQTMVSTSVTTLGIKVSGDPNWTFSKWYEETKLKIKDFIVGITLSTSFSNLETAMSSLQKTVEIGAKLALDQIVVVLQNIDSSTWFSNISTAVQNLAQYFANIFEAVNKVIGIVTTLDGKTVNNFSVSIGGLVTSAGNLLTKLAEILTKIDKIVSAGFVQFLEESEDELKQGLTVTVEGATTTFNNLKIAIEEVTEGLDLIADTSAPGLKDAIAGSLDVIVGAFVFVGEVIYSIIKPVVDAVGEWFKDGFDRVAQYTATSIDSVLDSFNKWLDKMDVLLNFFNKVVIPFFKPAFYLIGKVFGVGVQMIGDILSGLYEMVGGIVKTIVGFFLGDFDLMKEGVADIFYGIQKIIVNIFDRIIDATADFMIMLYKMIGSIKFSIPKIEFGGVVLFEGVDVDMSKFTNKAIQGAETAKTVMDVARMDIENKQTQMLIEKKWGARAELDRKANEEYNADIDRIGKFIKGSQDFAKDAINNYKPDMTSQEAYAMSQTVAQNGLQDRLMTNFQEANKTFKDQYATSEVSETAKKPISEIKPFELKIDGESFARVALPYLQNENTKYNNTLVTKK